MLGRRWKPEALFTRPQTGDTKRLKCEGGLGVWFDGAAVLCSAGVVSLTRTSHQASPGGVTMTAVKVMAGNLQNRDMVVSVSVVEQGKPVTV
jgi:hypothetical protein